MASRPAPVPAGGKPREEKIREPHPIDARHSEPAPKPPQEPAPTQAPTGALTAQSAPQAPELKTYSTRLPVPTIERLRLAAFQSRHSQQDLIIAALDAYLPRLPEE